MLRLCAFLCAALVSTGASAQAALAQAQTLISALGVMVKQMSVNSLQERDSQLQAQQALSSNAIEIYSREQVRDAIDQFGTNGQLVDGCYQVSMASQMGSTVAGSAARAMTVMSRLYTLSDNGQAKGSGISGVIGMNNQVTQFPYAASIASRVARHTSRYCTVSEAQLGYCSLNANGMQGGDQDFSLHLQPGKTYGWDQTEAASDFVKRIAPIQPVATSGPCVTPECIAGMRQRRDVEAYMSMARFSFMKFTESRSTQVGRGGSAQ